MRWRREAAALLIPFTFALIPVAGMVVATQSVTLPPGMSVVRMGLALALLVGAFQVVLRRFLSLMTAATALGLLFLTVGLYPLANTFVARTLSLPEFGAAAGYLAVCVVAACIPLGLAEKTQRAIFEILQIIAAIFLVFFTALIVRAYGFQQSYPAGTRDAVARLSSPLPVPQSVARKPDVFHLVLDGLGRADVLEARYGMKPDTALDQFRKLGFRVDRSIGQANYVQTHLSIPSMLNVAHLDDLSRLQGTSNNQEPLRELISRARVPHAFRQLGYRVEFIGGGSLSEGAFEEADVCDCPQLWFFEPEIGSLSLTPFKILLNVGIGHAAFFRRSLAVFDAFERDRADQSPRYVYAHVMMPHPPFVADEHGRFRNPRRPLSGADASFYMGSPEEYTASYRAQATFVLARTLTAVARVLDEARRQRREIVVIVSGDHGPRLGLDAAHPTAEMGRFTLPIWLAIRWPDGLAPDEPPKSLVNVYRVLFNQVFGMGLRRLPDRGYVSGFTTPYHLIAASPEAGESMTTVGAH
jgi:hypothetical protein